MRQETDWTNDNLLKWGMLAVLLKIIYVLSGMDWMPMTIATTSLSALWLCAFLGRALWRRME